MITKILFTMLVIIVVGMVFKSKSHNRTIATQQAEKPPTTQASSLAPKTVAYLLLGLLILVSGVVFYFSWSDAREIVTLRVINAAGIQSEYQAFRKDINGREFTSVDGVYTRLANSDRLEMILKN
jgi:hypothetical protein